MNAVKQTSNPFGIVQQSNTPATVESDTQRSIAEVQAALVIAKQFPRNEQLAICY